LVRGLFILGRGTEYEEVIIDFEYHGKYHSSDTYCPTSFTLETFVPYSKSVAMYSAEEIISLVKELL